MVPRVDTAPHVVETQPHRLIADSLGFVKPLAPGEYTIPSSEQNTFLMSTTPINLGLKRLSPRTIPAGTVWNPNCGYTIVASWGS